MPSDAEEKLITETFCKLEYIIVLSFHIVVITLILLSNIAVFVIPNTYLLAFDFYINYLPLESFPFAWELNYLVMVFWIVFDVLFYICYFPLPILLMNHSCWLLDMASMTAGQMNTDLNLKNDQKDLDVKMLAKRCGKFIKWQNKTQYLLRWNFNVEFKILTVISCLTIFSLGLDFFGSGFVLIIFLVCFCQLFVLCWMGTRIKNRLDQLSQDVSKNWYLIQPTSERTFR